jgi:hypothetical protein
MQYNTVIKKCFLGLIFLCGILSARAQEKTEHTVLSAPGGRFVFGQVSNMARDQYMLDTLTGRLWQIVKDSEGVIVLQRVPYLFGPDSRTLNAPEAKEEQAYMSAWLREKGQKEKQKEGETNNQ